MDVKRLFLIISLALVSYLMVVQWNKDYGPQAQAPVVQSTLPSSTPSVTHSGSEDIPQNSARDELAVSASEASTSLIEVRTDVLDLRIDPRGGDIVYAALPQHAARVDTP